MKETKMEQIVKECIDKYVGGNKYFHAMDNYIKYDKEILQELLTMVGLEDTLILSGQFGRQMVDYLLENKRNFNFILIVGSPRRMEVTEILNSRLYHPSGKAIFIDDTFFSGRTFFYCKGYVESKFNFKVNRCIVAYDGCNHEQNYLESLYRYYDNFDKNGEPLK